MSYPLDFSEYFKYDELTAHLQGLARATRTWPRWKASADRGESATYGR